MVSEALQKINDELARISPYKIDLVDPGSLQTAKKNARYMNNGMFKTLVNNVRQDKNLSSVPFCIKDEDGKYRVVSGNHRVQAAVQAKIEQILILYCENEIPREKEIAMQLSHNAISGQDDLVILRALWDEINTVNLKKYVGFDDNFIEKLEGIEFTAIKESPVEYKQVIFLFLPEEIDQLDQWLADFAALYDDDPVYIAKRKDYEAFFRTIAKSKKINRIMNNTVALFTALENVKLSEETEVLD